MAGARDIDRTDVREEFPPGPGFDLLPGATTRPPDDPDAVVPRQRRAGLFWEQFRRLRQLIAGWIEEESAFGHVFYWVPVLMGAGAAAWFSAAATPSTAYIAAVAMVFAAAAMAAGASRPGLRAVFAAICLFAAGAFFAALETARANTVILDTPVTTTVSGVVTEREADANGRWRYTIRVTGTEDPQLRRPPAFVKLTALGKRQALALGERVKGRARLSPPSGPALVGLNDFAFNAYFEGTGAIGFFYGTPASEGMWTGEEDMLSRVDAWLNGLRGRISEHIRSVLPGDTGAFAASMVTDDRRAMTRETAEALRLAGLAHIIAISGLNMALAAGIFFVGIRAALSLNQEIAHRYPVKKFAALGALISVTGYYLISGFAVSAERAYIMMAIMLVAAFFGRPSISLRNVALSAIVILVLSPSAVMGPGFQMSYAATLALVAGYAIWQHRQPIELPFAGIAILQRALPAWRFIAGLFLTSLIGGLSTALFSIEHFHRIAAYGLPANLLAMPIISFVVMPAGLLALILMPLGLDWLPLQVMGLGLDMVIAIAKWVASFNGDVVAGRIPSWLFAGMTAAFLLLALLRSKLRLAGAALAMLLMALYFALPGSPRPDLVIYEDGTLAGLVGGRTIASTRERPPAFIFEQWQRGLSVARHIRPLVNDAPEELADLKTWRVADQRAAEAKRLMQADLDHAETGRFVCRRKLWCVARAPNGAKIIQTEIGRLAGPACDLADIVITAARLKWSECHSGARIFTGSTLRRTGTVEVWFNPVNSRDFGIISAFGAGERPWYYHRVYDWRSGQFIRWANASRAKP